MNYGLQSGTQKTSELPPTIVEAIGAASNVFRNDVSYTDRRNEFAAAVLSASTGKIYAGGNFLSVNASGQVEAKECAEGTALAVGRSLEGAQFVLGAVVILNRVHEDQSNNGQTFGPCDRCRSTLVASAVSTGDRRNAKRLGESIEITAEILNAIPVVTGVYNPDSEIGSDEVLIIPLEELAEGDSICYDTRNNQTAIPLFVVHNAPPS